jgi:hypothetical protein
MSSPGDTILVGPGVYDGAFTFHKLEFVGDGAVINRGSSIFGYADAFDILGPDASGTTITDFSIEDVAWGVYGSYTNDVTVANLEITNAFHPIQCNQCSGWTVVHNRIDGMVPAGPPTTPAAENHQDAILFMTNSGIPTRNNFIAYNWIRDERNRWSGFARDLSAGIVLLTFGGLLENNVVIENEVEIKIEGLVPEANDSAAGIIIGALAWDGSPRDPSEVTGNLIVENDVLRTDEPIILVEESNFEGFLEANNIFEDNRVESDD